MKSGVTVRTDNAQAIIDSLKALTKKEVLVGIPGDASERGDGDISNAAIGYINENGSPEQNIPARPHLKPGVAAASDKFLPHLRAAAVKALDGNKEGAITSLNRAGSNAAMGVKRYMGNANFAPLSSSTLAARARAGRKGAKAELKRRKAGGDLMAASDTGALLSNQAARPLIDTKEYLESITYIVRDKDADA